MSWLAPFLLAGQKLLRTTQALCINFTTVKETIYALYYSINFLFSKWNTPSDTTLTASKCNEDSVVSLMDVLSGGCPCLFGSAWAHDVLSELYMCVVCVHMRWVLSVYRAPQAVRGIEDHSNLDPVVADPAQQQCVNVRVDADISVLSAVCQTK